MKILLTGAAGFLGWHTRIRLRALTDHEIVLVDRGTWTTLAEALTDADAVIHIAGVNRGDNAAVLGGNADLARDLAHALHYSRRPTRVVFANSIQDGNGTAYRNGKGNGKGKGKGQAREILTAAAEATGDFLVDVRLPNLFGEHGQPPEVTDRQVGLLHAQGAAAALIDGLEGDARRIDPQSTPVGVQEVLDLRQEFKASYATGEIPDLSSPFRVNLFNSEGPSLFPEHYPMRLTPRPEPRGTLVETIRVRDGEGQASFSTTVPPTTRGEHFHLARSSALPSSPARPRSRCARRSPTRSSTSSSPVTSRVRSTCRSGGCTTSPTPAARYS